MSSVAVTILITLGIAADTNVSKTPGNVHPEEIPEKSPIRNFLHIYSDSHVLPDSHVVHDFFYKNPLFLRLSRNVQC